MQGLQFVLQIMNTRCDMAADLITRCCMSRHDLQSTSWYFLFNCADLDHTNDRLRSSLVDWMKWLQHDIGFEGWRFDFVKGYGAEFMQQYCGETVGNNAFNVGEYWADLK